MLLLWSRLSALALMATLATCSPVPASPLKVVDTTPSLKPAPGPEQVTKFLQEDISVPSTLNITPPSILTNGITSRNLPNITVFRSARHPEQRNVSLWWPATSRPRYADIWITVYNKKVKKLIVKGVPLDTGAYDLNLPSWKTLEGGDAKKIWAALFFGFTTNNYHDRGVFGTPSSLFPILKTGPV